MNNRINTGLLSLLILPSFLSPSIASEDHHVTNHQVEPVELLVDFKISGTPTGMTPDPKFTNSKT